MNQCSLSILTMTGFLLFLAATSGLATENKTQLFEPTNRAPEPAPNIPSEEEKQSAEEQRALQNLAPLPLAAPLAAPYVGPVLPATDGLWISQGPGPTQSGQVENVTPNNEVVGAVHTVVAHPTNANIIWVGGSNGGIWKTTNATAASPNWTPLIDHFTSLSIGAMELDPTDATSQTLVAGVGRFSSFGSQGGPFVGLLKTVDGGSNWSEIGESDLSGRNITGVGPRGDTIVVAASTRAGGTSPGIYRSIDGGTAFSLISGTNGLPFGSVFDLVGDHGDQNRFYAGLATGIFRSDDGGLNWTNITDPAINGLLGGATNNVEFAVHNNLGAGTNAVYVGVVNNGQLAGFFRSADQGTTWTAMDVPQTNEGGPVIGLQPRERPGSQGATHFSILADPNDANTVYVGGDRQPTNAGPDGIAGTMDDTWPNFIGAVNFTGRLFRGDANVASTGTVPSPQWEHLTHLDSIAAIPGGGTSNNSSPHADSREMVFDAVGNIIEGDDGGIYRRTSPEDNSGDWFSINGNLQTTEFHDIVYDTVADIIMGGAQDTGTHEQNATGSATYTDIQQADGGDVAVDSTSAAGQSTRFWSTQNLGGFSRRICDSLNTCGASINVGLNEPGGTNTLVGQFVTPVELNVTDQTRLIIGGQNAVWESFDQGDNITQVAGPGANRNAMVYGHPNNTEFIAIGSGSGVFLRTAAGGNLAPTPTPFPGGTIVDITVDPANENIIYAIDTTRVFETIDAGVTWDDVTGNLMADGAGIRTLEYIEEASQDRLVVGSNAGVLVAFEGILGAWFKLASDLPNAPNWDLDYDPGDDVLVTGTLGRGAWLLENASELVPFCDPTTPGAIIGTPAADQLLGTAGDDVIIGLGGDDNINGLGGNDCIDGGAGADNIVGAEGSDLIFGKSGNDKISSGSEADVIFGEDGNDNISGGADDDNIVGGDGFDRITGGPGEDNCVSGELVSQCE